MRIALVLVMASLAVACSSRGVYENVQLDRQNQCAPLPPGQYEDCMEGYTQPYEEYECERQELITE